MIVLAGSVWQPTLYFLKCKKKYPTYLKKKHIQKDVDDVLSNIVLIAVCQNHLNNCLK